MIHYTKLRLKVLRGINKGAVARFSSNSICIGSSPECDIVLSGFIAHKPSIEISYIDNRLSLKVINEAIKIDGEVIQPSDKLVPLKLYQLISFGSCCLTIGEQGKDWPPCDDSNKIDPPHSKQKNIYSMLHFFKSKDTSISKKILMVISVFLVIYIVFLVNIKSIMSIDISSTSLASAQELKSVIRSYNPKPLDSADVERMAYGLLQSYGVNRIDLSFQKDGTLIAKGYVGDAKRWERAKTSILEDINPITKIDTSEIVTFSKRVTVLNEMLRINKIKHNLQVEADEGKDLILVTGELPSSAVVDWLNVRSQFLSISKGMPKLKSNIENLENKLRLLIRSVSIGKTKYFISKAGQKYMTGSNLGKGFRVLEIDIDKITLSYRGDVIPLYYGAKSNKLINNK